MNGELSVLQGLILGIVQGITEFIPVSSSGHLVLSRVYLGMPPVPLFFDVFLHIATLLVICLHYRSLIGALIASFVRWISRKHTEDDTEHLWMIGALIVATCATVVGALLLRALFPQEPSVRFVSILLLVTATILIISTFPKGSKVYSSLKWYHMILIGLSQAVGTLAGISRSGITISTALLCGVKREKAGEFSFILSIPAVIGAFVYSIADLFATTSHTLQAPEWVGFFASFIAGMAALRLLLWMVKRAKLWYFSLYLIVVGALGLILSIS